MSALSEVSVLIAQRARDIEKAREIFTAEIRAFVIGILAGIRRVRTDPWTTSRVRLDLPKEPDFEAKSSSEFSNQYATARVSLRFKKGTNFRVIAEVHFGIEFDEDNGTFVWRVTLVPSASYNRVDDVCWHQWRTTPHGASPGSRHLDRSNTVRFISRPISPELTAEVAFNDTKNVLEFLLTTEAGLADAVGLDAGADE